MGPQCVIPGFVPGTNRGTVAGTGSRDKPGDDGPGMTEGQTNQAAARKATALTSAPTSASNLEKFFSKRASRSFAVLS